MLLCIQKSWYTVFSLFFYSMCCFLIPFRLPLYPTDYLEVYCLLSKYLSQVGWNTHTHTHTEYVYTTYTLRTMSDSVIGLLQLSKIISKAQEENEREWKLYYMCAYFHYLFCLLNVLRSVLRSFPFHLVKLLYLFL